jgi:hypothetical protein
MFIGQGSSIDGVWMVYGIVHYSNFLYIPDQNQKRKKKKKNGGEIQKQAKGEERESN